jgi:hypothetical protein
VSFVEMDMGIWNRCIKGAKVGLGEERLTQKLD